MAKRILNRKDLRVAYDEAQRRKEKEERDEDEEEEQEEDAEEEEEGEEEEEEAEEEGEEEEEEVEEEAPPKKKKVAKPRAKPRSRSTKVVRMRVIWGVFNNSHQMVASYEYPRKNEAQEHAARLTTDKRSTHFVQPVKEPIEEKKEKGAKD